MGKYMFSVLTAKDIRMLEESYRRGAMLFDSEEHDQFIEDCIHYAPRLIQIARQALSKPKRAGKKR